MATEPRECSKCNTLTRQQDSADDEASMERDRTMGKDSMVNFGMHDSSSEEWPQNSGNPGNGSAIKRICLMCDAPFPPTITDETLKCMLWNILLLKNKKHSDMFHILTMVLTKHN